jgi:hypothetical protein
VVPWVHFNDERPPLNKTIDVWVAYTVAGEFSGYREADCWFYQGEVLKGRGNTRIRGATHWMLPPLAPPLDARGPG